MSTATQVPAFVPCTKKRGDVFVTDEKTGQVVKVRAQTFQHDDEWFAAAVMLKAEDGLTRVRFLDGNSLWVKAKSGKDLGFEE